MNGRLEESAAGAGGLSPRAEEQALSDLDLPAIRERWARVIPGPWAVRPVEGATAQGIAVPERCETIVSMSARLGHEVVVAIVPVPGRPDAEAIAWAREDVPRLLAEAERLRGAEAEVARLRARVAELEALVELARQVGTHVEQLIQAAVDAERAECARRAERLNHA